MKEKEDKNIEQFIQIIIKETSLESPSPDFTSKVMANVLALEKTKATVYKPLISKTGWIFIFGGIIATIVYLVLNEDAIRSGSQPWWVFGAGAKNFIKTFSDLQLFRVSQLTINVILLATILMIIQITLLKNYFDKRLAK